MEAKATGVTEGEDPIVSSVWVEGMVLDIPVPLKGNLNGCFWVRLGTDALVVRINDMSLTRSPSQ